VLVDARTATADALNVLHNVLHVVEVSVSSFSDSTLEICTGVGVGTYLPKPAGIPVKFRPAVMAGIGKTSRGHGSECQTRRFTETGYWHFSKQLMPSAHPT